MKDLKCWFVNRHPQPLHCSSVSEGSYAAVSGSVALRFLLIGCLVLRGWAFRGAGGLLKGDSFVKESSTLRVAAREWALSKFFPMLSKEKGSKREQCFFKGKAEG